MFSAPPALLTLLRWRAMVRANAAGLENNRFFSSNVDQIGSLARAAERLLCESFSAGGGVLLQQRVRVSLMHWVVDGDFLD